MTSTEFSIGMSGERNSSRVLKPPGGGHTNIFAGGAPEAHVPSPRPKYDQQNSSNLNFCMNTVDPNIKVVEQTKQEVVSKPAASAPAASAPADAGPKSAAAAPASNGNGNAAAPPPQSDAGNNRSRVPPGGFSSGGFW